MPLHFAGRYSFFGLRRNACYFVAVRSKLNRPHLNEEISSTEPESIIGRYVVNWRATMSLWSRSYVYIFKPALNFNGVAKAWLSDIWLERIFIFARGTHQKRSYILEQALLQKYSSPSRQKVSHYSSDQCKMHLQDIQYDIIVLPNTPAISGYVWPSFCSFTAVLSSSSDQGAHGACKMHFFIARW
jgi:hypothetical protein